MSARVSDYPRYVWQLLNGFRINHERAFARMRAEDIAPYLERNDSLRVLDLANGHLRPQYTLLKASGHQVYGLDLVNRFTSWRREVTMKRYLPAGAALLFLAILLLAGTIKLESAPPLWWDEGWTLSVARNWVERGHYGRLLAGQPGPPGLEASFPVAASVALSFRLLGVGVWQGRLVGVVYMIGALALIYYLALRLYNHPIAGGALAILLLTSSHIEIHPVFMGRQVLAEIPALFYLLAGYACFLSAARKPFWPMLMAAGFWGVALITKLQVLPFWTASLLVPFLVALFQRNWRPAVLLLVASLGSLAASQLLLESSRLLLHRQGLAPTPIQGLYEVAAVVPIASVRFAVLMVVFLFGFPTLFGLCHATWKFAKDRSQRNLDIHLEVVRLALLVLAGSWFVWYLLLSAGWLRYLFPPTFLSSIFVSVMLHDLSDKFSLSSTINRAGYALRYLRFDHRAVGALAAIVLVAFTSTKTVTDLSRAYLIDADNSAVEVAKFLNTQTPANALIETYDSELFFFLNRRYHYPPDQIHVELNRRTFLGQNVPINYDPLAADPDYLVVGPHSKLWKLYDPVLEAGAFRPLRAYSRYDLYERVR